MGKKSKKKGRANRPLPPKQDTSTKDSQQQDVEEDSQRKCIHGWQIPTDRQHEFFSKVASDKPDPIRIEDLMRDYPEVVADPTTVPLGLALATDMLLQWDGHEWDNCCGVAQAFVVAASGHLAKGSIWRNKDGTEVSQEVFEENLRKLARIYQAKSSLRDIVQYLDRKIPCSCLAALKEKVLREPDLCKCDNCNEYVETAKVCRGCKVYLYCSEECQALAWPDHKYTCKFYAGKLTAAEAIAKMEAREAKRASQNDAEEVD